MTEKKSRLPAKRRAHSYSEAEVETGLRALAWCSGNTRRASKLLGHAGQLKIPRGTLKSWVESGGPYATRYAQVCAELRPEINRRLAAAHESLADAYLDAEWQTLRAYEERIGEMKGGELARASKDFSIASGIHGDKSFRYRGEPGEIKQAMSFEDGLRVLHRYGMISEDRARVLIGEAEEVESAEVERPKADPP